MKVLYKYYSENFDVVDHLKNPAIKLATTRSLNDPFEVQLSNELAKSLTNKRLKIFDEKLLKDKKFREDVKKSYQIVSNQFGIISLTETHRNILMWAHYANSHKGVCIGYKKTFIDELNHREHPISDEWKGIYTPEKIRYDSKRFELEIDSEETENEIIMQAMLKKSDDWIYEKEHRCIVPFHMADRFKLIRENSGSMNFIANEEKLKRIEKISEEKGYKSLLTGMSHIRQMRKIAHTNGLIMLKDIDVNSICSIFIGSKCNKKTEQSIIDEIESNKSRYGHVSVYRYHIHGNDFKLYTEGLINWKLLTDINDALLENELDVFQLP
ncbi:DUF2971 domain-containing protein [Aeromonas veronii]|uniref:DUF2971 domain-containing protein n=1 Tax=Aeromonas veronii TaxID=654 RepID=UPI0031FDC8FC